MNFWLNKTTELIKFSPAMSVFSRNWGGEGRGEGLGERGWRRVRRMTSVDDGWQRCRRVTTGSIGWRQLITSDNGRQLVTTGDGRVQRRFRWPQHRYLRIAHHGLPCLHRPLHRQFPLGASAPRPLRWRRIGLRWGDLRRAPRHEGWEYCFFSSCQ